VLGEIEKVGAGQGSNNQLEPSGKRFCMIYKTSFGGGYSICSFSVYL